jgi:hypothetical protein
MLMTAPPRLTAMRACSPRGRVTQCEPKRNQSVTATDAGVPVHVLRKIAGHGSLVTTQRYLHPDSQSITAAGAALSAHLAAMTAE